LTPEFWNRQELYKSVWRAPLTKISSEYGVSTYTLARVCNKLQIPRPGRGYWRKLEVGRRVSRKPITEVKDPPLAPRVRRIPKDNSSNHLKSKSLDRRRAALAIEQMESKIRSCQRQRTTHALISPTKAALSETHILSRQWILRAPYGSECLDLRVSKRTLGCALKIMNTILLVLEEQGYSVKLVANNRRMEAWLDGQQVPFYLREKLRLRSRRQVRGMNLLEFQYEPTGRLEFRVGDDYLSSRYVEDCEDFQLENAIHLCVGAVMREARRLEMKAQGEALREVREEQKRKKLEQLSTRIAKEEARVRDLEVRMKGWRQAKEIRKFIREARRKPAHGDTCLSASRRRSGRKWMERQADRLDPFKVSPSSILDEKSKLRVDQSAFLSPFVSEQFMFASDQRLFAAWRRHRNLKFGKGNQGR